MRIKSGLYAGIATVVVILALGNQWSYENAVSGETAANTRNTISFYLRFEVWNLSPDLRTAAVVRLVLLVLIAAVLGAVVGGDRPAAAFVGGWATFLAASIISAGVYGVIADETLTGVTTPSTVDLFTTVSGVGVGLGLWVGWVVGLAVLWGNRDERGTASATESGEAATPAWDHPQGPPEGAAVIGPDRTHVLGEPPVREA